MQIMWVCSIPLLLLPLVICNGKEINVLPECSRNEFLINECTTITDAFNHLNESNTTLYLSSGAPHILHNFSLVLGLSNIAIVGTNQEEATIVCSEGVGLAFVNIINLTIEDVTVDGCGLKGASLGDTIRAVNDSISSFFDVPLSLGVAVMIGDVANARLQKLSIRNTIGIGLLGINVIGSSHIEQVMIQNNTYEKCTIGILSLTEALDGPFQRQIGGGAFLVYYDYHQHQPESNNTTLTIHNSTFFGNLDCSVTGPIAWRMKYSEALRSRGYTVGAGGGLSVMFTQTDYSASLTISSSLFDGNAANYGSGVFVGTFFGVRDSMILLNECNFTNGRAPKLPHLSNRGGGVAVLTSLSRPISQQQLIESKADGIIIVHVTNSVFEGSNVFAGGGLYSLFLPISFGKCADVVTFTIEKCTFWRNKAAFGAAIFAEEHNIITIGLVLNPSHQVEASSIFAAFNSIISDDPSIKDNKGSSGVIDVQYVYFALSGNSTLENNNGTALRATSSQVHVSGQTVFHGNVGAFGGAISLIAYSYVIVRPRTSVVFKNNQAIVRGGVFHIQLDEGRTYTPDDCFLYFNSSDQIFCYSTDTCSNISQLGITLTFSGNNAPYGSIVYGATLETCFWTSLLTESNNITNFWQFLATDESTQDIFIFDKVPTGIDEVITSTGELMAHNLQYSAMPGQMFHIEMAASDRFIQQIPTAVTSTVLSTNLSAQDEHIMSFTSSMIGFSNFWALRQTTTSMVPLRVMGREHEEVEVAVFTTDSGAFAIIRVNLTSCVLGFEHSSNESSCVCQRAIEWKGVTCSSETHQLTVPSHVWVGPWNNEELAIQRCILDYCTRGEKLIEPGDFDVQCAEGYHRTGLLCGSCMEGYSVVLGTNRCKQCHNNAFLALILVFAVAGILLIALITFLKVSVSEGYLNGILFYSHDLSQYTFLLAPKAPAIFLPIAFLNFDLGVEVCFYDGMNSLAKTGLQFVFPFYIYFLMGTAIIACRFINKLPPKLLSAGKTIATLLVLSYTSILSTCIETLRYVVIGSISDHDVATVRWFIDPHVHYFHGWHAFLAIMSILLILVYLVPLPLILLFPSKAYSNKYIGKLKPILDAFFAPYQSKLRCWLGVRLLVSIVLSTISSFLKFPLNIFVVEVVLAAFIFVQTQLRPYRGFCRNATDNLLLINILILLLGLIFFDEGMDDTEHTIFSAVIVLPAYTAFIGLLLYHIYLRLPECKQQNIKKRFEQIKLLKKVCSFIGETYNEATQQNDLDLFDFAPIRGMDEVMENVHRQSIVEAPQDGQGHADMISANQEYKSSYIAYND